MGVQKSGYPGIPHFFPMGHPLIKTKKGGNKGPGAFNSTFTVYAISDDFPNGYSDSDGRKMNDSRRNQKKCITKKCRGARLIRKEPTI